MPLSITHVPGPPPGVEIKADNLTIQLRFKSSIKEGRPVLDQLAIAADLGPPGLSTFIGSEEKSLTGQALSVEKLLALLSLFAPGLMQVLQPILQGMRIYDISQTQQELGRKILSGLSLSNMGMEILLGAKNPMKVDSKTYRAIMEEYDRAQVHREKFNA